MAFGLNNCGYVSFHRGKLVDTGDVPLPSEEVIRQLSSNHVYRYLGVFEADNCKTQMMKEKLLTDNKQRLKMILRSHLSGRNIVQAINSYVVSVMRYSEGIIHCTKEDLYSIDVLTRKQLLLHRAFI